MFTRLAVAAAIVCTLGAIQSTQANNGGGFFNGGSLTNAGTVTVPDGGASLALLALGCSGVAIAIRKRIK